MQTTNPKSERPQTLTAVLFMSLFAAVFLIFVSTRERMASFLCRYEGFGVLCANEPSPHDSNVSGPLINSQIVSACVDASGLKISVAFEAPMTGHADIQVFTTGEDVFPAEQGMSDTFKTSMAMDSEISQLDFSIPVETMPVGEQIFGNITTTWEDLISSHIAYFVTVSDCSPTGSSISNPTLITDRDATPRDYSVSCLSGNRMMLALEFDRPVRGQYRALVADKPYRLSSIGNQPVILFFSGDSPQENPILIKLVSATDQAVLFEETITSPDCSPQ